MVTLALFAMAGMLGLAVDLGWAFFVQKQAQAAADGAALAAVHETYFIVSGSTAFSSCPSTVGKDGATVDCNNTAEYCGTTPLGGGSTLNTYHGCLYAKSQCL